MSCNLTLFSNHLWFEEVYINSKVSGTYVVVNEILILTENLDNRSVYTIIRRAFFVKILFNETFKGRFTITAH